MIRVYKYGKLHPATLVRRYKRFLADVRFGNNRLVTAFCPNSGSMSGLSRPGMPVMLSKSDSRQRKLKYTLEMVKAGKTWVGVNTHLANELARILLERGLAGGPLSGYKGSLKREHKIGNSRLDFLLSDGARNCFVEVKNVTLKEGSNALFPDAVTKRGTKHLKLLTELAESGNDAVMIYIVQRRDCHYFRTADEIDPEYASAFAKAVARRVDMRAYRFRVTPDAIHLMGTLPVC